MGCLFVVNVVTIDDHIITLLEENSHNNELKPFLCHVFLSLVLKLVDIKHNLDLQNGLIFVLLLIRSKGYVW